jgi:capsule biosynthesis phosphatase
MSKINIMIPMNGLGSRFRDEDYLFPKPLINILGRPMIFWLLDNLNLADIEEIIIPYTSTLDSFKFVDQLKQRYKNVKFRFLSLNYDTRGAAETVLVALESCPDHSLDNRLMIMDCDTFYFDDIVDQYVNSVVENHIFYFEDKNQQPLYSYIKTDNYGFVLDIQEKVKISDKANTGTYCFESGRLVKELCTRLLKGNHKQKNEFYISGLYKLLLDDKVKVTSSDVSDFHCVGTPTQLKMFCENHTNVKPQRFCFDLDNTLVTSPVVAGDYSTCKPIEDNINFVKHLHRQGHHIIISTARRMRTHGGNVQSVVRDIGRVTLDQLDKFGVPYDDIQFGKPWADFYIDDLAINCNMNLEKQLGYYNTSIKSRAFNHVEILNTMVIKSGKIAGERFYYNSIPDSLKDVFPSLLEDTNEKLIIERIRGINFSHLYGEGALTEEMFTKLLKALGRLHKVKGPSGNFTKANIQKIVDRYESYDYNRFVGHKQTLNKIIEFLEKYEQKHSTMIHGDPVFTNVLLDKNDCIKLIDMRGMVGDTFTIYGDPIYDLAKVYQSLMGYDFILNGVTSKKVDNKLISALDIFAKTEYGINIEDIKRYSAGLYFSLIPLHNDEKCQQYYQLAQSLMRGSVTVTY